MKRILLLAALFWAFAMTTSAQLNAILGDWKTVDDRSGENFSIVTIYRGSDGLYYGKISKMLVGPPDLRCEQCPGEDHNARIEGLVFIRGMKYDAGKNQLVGGKLLDPESGKFYYGKIYPKNGQLVLRGSIDKLGVLGRSQTWIRK